MIPPATKILRLSVTLGELTDAGARQPDLFANDDAERQRCETLTQAMDSLKKTDRDAAAIGVRTGLNACVLFAILAQPFIPDAAKVVLDALGVPEDRRGWPKVDDRGVWDALARGHKFAPPDVLFKKIEDEQVADLAARFGGGGAA